MIAKGNTHNNGAKLAAYMSLDKEGERVNVWQLRGFGATNIKDAFRDVQIMAEATRCEQPLFHVQVRNREGETLTNQQWEYVADRIERMLGLSGQPRAIAFHTYEHNNDTHMHVAWSRIDEDTLTAKQLPYFKDRLKKISRELETHFALEPVIHRRESVIGFAPKKAEEEQARRLGLDIHTLRETIRSCWDRSDCGRSFDDALAHDGFILAQGERRDFVVIDRAGGMHALGKRILGVPAAHVRDRMSDLDRDHIPTVEQARSFMLDLPRDRMDRLTRELSEVQKQIQIEKEYAKRDPVRENMAWEDAVAKAAIEKEKVEKKFVEPQEREKQTTAKQAEPGSRKEKVVPVEPARREPKPSPGLQRAATEVTKNSRKPLRTSAKAVHKAAGVAVPVIGKTLDIIGGLVESLAAPTFSPEQIQEGEKAKARREAEAEADILIDFTRQSAEIAQQRQQGEQEQAARQRERGGRER